EAVSDWLSRHGLRAEIREDLAETVLTVESLDRLAREGGRGGREIVLPSLGSGHRTRVLASEVEVAAGRIHSLVAAIKGFTHMDQSNVPKPVAIGQGLYDTMAVLGAKARGKSVTVRIDVAHDLPPVDGLGGELNQV